MNEEKKKLKTEIRMLIWYLLTEPIRKLKKMLHKVDKTITPEMLTYFYFVFAIILLLKNWRDYKWICGMFIVIVIWIRYIWRKKKFIGVYRKERYIQNTKSSFPPLSPPPGQMKQK